MAIVLSLFPLPIPSFIGCRLMVVDQIAMQTRVSMTTIKRPNQAIQTGPAKAFWRKMQSRERAGGGGGCGGMLAGSPPSIEHYLSDPNNQRVKKNANFNWTTQNIGYTEFQRKPLFQVIDRQTIKR